MKAMSWSRLAAVLLTLMFSAPPVQAQGVTLTTLEKIRDYGAIYVGHAESSVPFSYMVGDEVVGYSIDLCGRIVDAIRAELKDPALKVVLVPITSTSSLLMLMTGVIDLECGSTTNTRIRQQQVAFSVTTFVSGVKALVRKDAKIERITDLNGKVVVTTAGTTTDRLVRAAGGTRNISMQFKSGRIHADSFNMVLSRQADAFVLDDAILAGLIANSPDGDKVKLLEDNFGLEPYGIGMRRDDPEFKKLVDGTLIGMMKNGELETIYKKWFAAPIPPNNATLNIPMSDMLKELLRNPSDAGI